MRNFSISIHELDDSHCYLFAYSEYTGKDYKADMEAMAKEPRKNKRLSVTDAIADSSARRGDVGQNAEGVPQSLGMIVVSQLSAEQGAKSNGDLQFCGLVLEMFFDRYCRLR
jgi:hypothetical protein